MPMHTMKDLLIEQLNELHAAEKHGAEVLPRLARAASDPKLAAAFRAQAEAAGVHIGRLREVMNTLGSAPRTPTEAESKGMKGLCEDCLKLANMPQAEPHVRDAALIAVAQHVKHDEMAGYGCARTWAGLLGLGKAASELQKSLEDERRADKDLTRLADSLNRAAVAVSIA